MRPEQFVKVHISEDFDKIPIWPYLLRALGQSLVVIGAIVLFTSLNGGG